MPREAVGGITVMAAVGGSVVIAGPTEGEATVVVVVTDWAKRNGAALIRRRFENGGLNWRGVWLEFAEFMVAPKTTENRDRLMDPWWRKARIGARLIQKREEGKPWTERDKRLARMLAEDPGVTNRLLDQAWWSLRARKRNGPGLMGWFN